MAGLNHVFTSSREACDNCGNQAEEGHLISGTNPVTPMLLDYVKIGELPDITPANVVPFLVKNLKWRIVPVSFAFYIYIHVGNLLTTCVTYRRAVNWKTLAMSLASRLEFLLSCRHAAAQPESQFTRNTHKLWSRLLLTLLNVRLAYDK
jgi:hypothetical protein